jgi:AbrB family looped-hinge helix DNA binding protein
MIERYIIKVSEKGQVVIPVRIRRKFGIKREVAFIDEDDRVTLVSITPM